jgi:hypothetical protein
MGEVRTGIPETPTPQTNVIDFQAARQKRLSEPRQDVAVHNQTETPQQERGQEPNVTGSTAAITTSVPTERNHLANEAKDNLIDLEAVRRKLREEQYGKGGIRQEKRQGTGTAISEAVALDPMVREIQGSEADLPPGKMKVVLDKDTYALIDTPEEKARKREIIPQAERQRLAEVIHAYGSRPLTEDEWQIVERSSHLNAFFDTLDAAGRGKVGYKQELLEKEMHERFGKLLKERMTDRYPAWWKVYDKEGNRIWKMSLMDKALLAKWRRFDGLPPDEKLAILREWAETHIRKEETVGEKFAKAIEHLCDFLLALFAPVVEEEENSDRPAYAR